MVDTQEFKLCDCGTKFTGAANKKYCSRNCKDRVFQRKFYKKNKELIKSKRKKISKNMELIKKIESLQEQLAQTQQALDSAVAQIEFQEKQKQSWCGDFIGAKMEIKALIKQLTTTQQLLKQHHEIAKADIETYVKLDDGTFVPLNAQEGYAESGFWEETEVALAGVKE